MAIILLKDMPLKGLFLICNAVIMNLILRWCVKNWPNILSSRPCQTCYGARLREEARHVFIDNKNLPEISVLFN